MQRWMTKDVPVTTTPVARHRRAWHAGRRQWTIILGGMLLGLGAAGGFPSAVARADTALVAASRQTDADLAVLADPNATPEARDNAARKLVIAHNDSTRAALADILRANRGGQLALTRALAVNPWADPQFIDPLFSLLTGHERDVTRAAAAALGQYKGDNAVLTRLAELQAGSASDEVRLAVIHAIGMFDQKSAAATLIDILQHSGNPAIENAAADALAAMTGYSENGRDAQRWQQWWATAQNESEVDFVLDLVRRRAAVYAQRVSRYEQLQGAVEKLCQDAVDQAPKDKRADMVARFLHSQAPEIRAQGAMIVYRSRANGQGTDVADAMKEVRRVLGDSEPAVRGAAAAALYNDADSTAQLVAQLKVETSDEVISSLIHSLGPLQSVEATALIIRVFYSNPSPRLQLEAAAAIQLAAPLLDQHADLKTHAEQALMPLLEDRARQPGATALRVAVVAALGALRDNTLLTTFRDLAKANEPPGVRVEAIRALGALQAQDLVATYFLADAAPAIRLAAVQALGVRATPAFLDPLTDHVFAGTEADPVVRAEAWRVLQQWLASPDLKDDEVLHAAANLQKQNDGDKYESALIIYCDRQRAIIKNADSAAEREQAQHALAVQQVNLGDQELALKKPALAATQYQAALEYWKANGGDVANIETLTDSLSHALLQSHQWDKAITLATDAIKQAQLDPSQSPTAQLISVNFQQEAQKMLTADPPDLDNLAAFFAAYDKMNPKLPGGYDDKLNSIRQELANKRGH